VKSSKLNILEINNLKTYYFATEGVVKAVDDVTLYIKNKEALAVVGESGSGKSTLAYSIVKLLPENGRILNGNIWLYPDKIDLVRLSENEIRKIRGNRIGVIFQDPMTFLNPVMKVGDQIAEALIFHKKCSQSEAKRKAIELLEKLKIPDASAVASQYPHQLSGGMKQRVMIAIAISCNPQLLIADEPTTALDVTIQAQVLELLKDLQLKLGMSLILVTHDLGVVAKVCDRVAIMYAGKIVEIGDIYSLYKKPIHPYTKGLLQATPTIQEPGKKIMAIGGSVPNLINPPSGCRFHPRCPYATEKCKMKEPPFVNVDKERYVSCWLIW